MVLAVADLIIEFLRGIGLSVQERTLTIATILPGITVDRGGLIIDRTQMTYPGDLLHEAGHLAIMPKAERNGLSVNVGADPGYEMAAIAWSYAAAVHLGLPAEVVFHDAGYKAGASALRENFAEGRYIGVPVLQWRGLADAPGSATGYPAMKRWVCE